MGSGPVNFIISLLSLIPILILMIVSLDLELNFIIFLILFILASFISAKLIDFFISIIVKKGNLRNYKLVNIELSEGEILNSFSSIFLPILLALGLLFNESKNKMYLLINMFGVLLYLILIFKSNTWYSSPMLKIFSKYKVYKVTTSRGLVLLMLSKHSLAKTIQLQTIVEINENVIVGVD